MDSFRNIALGFALSAFTLMLPATAQAEQGTLSQCQLIQDQIERYTKLRRQGGSSEQMTSWQKSRNHYKEEYSKYGCRIHRGKLKR